eukprot:4382367-Ditylum_brightwellii.AAC.1
MIEDVAKITDMMSQRIHLCYLLSAIAIQDSAETTKDSGSEWSNDNIKDAKNKTPVYNLNFDWCTYLVESA